MNREIKFRAWDGTKMTDNPDVSTYGAGVNDEFYYAQSGQSKLIFMQYTGLKDKSGKEIYEGDICNGRYGRFVVEFFDGGFHPLCGDTNAENNSELIEIIGNIYETPGIN